MSMDHENRREERGPLRRGFQGEEREQRKIGAKARNCCWFMQRRRYPLVFNSQVPTGLGREVLAPKMIRKCL